MKTPSNLQLQAASISRPGYSVAFTITATSPDTLIFRVHEGQKPLGKKWWAK
jgi:hypothetical protein